MSSSSPELTGLFGGAFDPPHRGHVELVRQAKAKLGQFDEALKITAGLIQAGEESGSAWYFLQLKGMVQREAGKTDAAIETHLEVLDKLDAAKGLKDDVRDRMKDRNRYVLTGLYVDVKDIDKAAKHNVIHKNTAARKKSQLARRIAALKKGKGS